MKGMIRDTDAASVDMDLVISSIGFRTAMTLPMRSS